MKNNINKYKIYGRSKGRKKNNFDLDKKIVNNIVSKKIILNKKQFNILDIGSGSGESTLYLSKMYPKSNIVACENFLDGNQNLIYEIIKNKKNNIKIYNGNVLEFFDKNQIIDVFDLVWILFPDPWPKKRHFKRRLINKNFMEKLNKILKKNGRLHIVSDSSSYLRQIFLTIFEFKNNFLWENQSKTSWDFDKHKLPETKFYKKAIKSDRKPIYIILRKL